MISSTSRRTVAWATAVPLVCSLHCLATPLLVVLAPALALDPRIEAGMFAGVLVVAAVAAYLGVRAHRQLAVLGPIATGLAVWGGSLLLLSSGGEILTALASVLVAAGLLWNARLRHRASCPACHS